MRYIKNLFLMSVFIFIILITIGAFSLPANAFIDTYQVQIDVNLHSLEYFSDDANTSNQELMMYHEAIIKIAEEHCSDKEISELNDLFHIFLMDRNKESLKVYSDTVTEVITGKPNYILFFAVIALAVVALSISIRKMK